MRRKSQHARLLIGAWSSALVVVGASCGAHEARRARRAATLVFAGVRRSDFARSGARLRRRVAPRHRADLRESRRPQARDDARSRPGSRRAGSRQGRQGLDVQPPAGCQVPRRHAVQRGGGLLQLQPLVQLQRPVPGRRARRTTTRRSSAASRTTRARPLGQPLYKSCKAKGTYSGRDHADQAVRPVPPALSLTTFAIAEPDGAEEVRRQPGRRSGTASSRRRARTAFQHPTGTGPFKFESWTVGEKLELVRNNQYWGKKAKLDRDHLPARSPTTRPASRRCRRASHALRPRRPQDVNDDQEQLKPEAAHAAGVQRRAT